MKKESSLRSIIVITAITLIAGLLLGLTHEVTAEPIQKQQEAARTRSSQAVFEDAASFEEIETSKDQEALSALFEDHGLKNVRVNAVYRALDASGAFLGFVIDSTSGEGYGGDVEIMAGIREDADALLNGISFLQLSETAGMGMKAKDEPFLSQFKGLQASETIVYTKSGKQAPEEIDAISGCTITTSAVTDAVNAAIVAAGYFEEVEQ